MIQDNSAPKGLLKVSSLSGLWLLAPYRVSHEIWWVFSGFEIPARRKTPPLVWSTWAAAQLPLWGEVLLRGSVCLSHFLFVSIVSYPPGLPSWEEPSFLSLMISNVCLSIIMSILRLCCSRLKNSASSKPLLTGQVLQTSNFGLILCSHSPC